MGGLKLHPLTETLCEILGKKLCEADLIDCAAHDYDGVAALKDAMHGGPSAAIFEGDTCIGAIGWTYEGFVWSLWQDLSPEQSRKMMALTVPTIRSIATQAQRPLCNVVWEGNRRTIAWLKASHCFEFLDIRQEYKDKVFIPFFVKPLGDLANV